MKVNVFLDSEHLLLCQSGWQQDYNPPPQPPATSNPAPQPVPYTTGCRYAATHHVAK